MTEDFQIILNVFCRDRKFLVKCGKGYQTFKWLANTVRDRYARGFPEFKAEQFTPINVYSHNETLYHSEQIYVHVVNEQDIFIELLGPRIGVNDPNFVRKKTLWELFAYAPKPEYVEVKVLLDGNDLDKSEDGTLSTPAVLGNFVSSGEWRMPVFMKDVGNNQFELNLNLPAHAEIFFVFFHDSKFIVSDNYEKVLDESGRFLNCLKTGPPDCNYSQLKIPKVDPRSFFFTNNPDEPTRKVKERTHNLIESAYCQPTEEEKLKIFDSHWRKIYLDDVLPLENDREKARAKLFEYHEEIKSVFLYYAKMGMNVAFMNILSFMCFCSQCKLPDSKVLTKSKLFEIFHKVNIEGEIAKGKAIDINEPLNPDNQFTRAEFMEALVRMALIKYDSQPIDYGMTSIMDLHIRKYTQVPEKDVLRGQLIKQNVQKVFVLFDRRLFNLFIKYASVDQLDRQMDFKAWQQLIIDFKLVGEKLSLRDLAQIFSLSQQEDGINDDADTLQMAFPEFCEGLARLADHQYDRDEDFHKMDLADKLEALFLVFFPKPENTREKKKRVTIERH